MQHDRGEGWISWLEFSPDELDLASCATLTRLWDVASETEIRHFSHHGFGAYLPDKGWASKCLFTPDGKKLVIGVVMEHTGVPNDIELRNIKTGHAVCLHEGGFSDVDYTDGCLAIARNHSISLVFMSSGYRETKSFKESMKTIAFSPDGTHLAANGVATLSRPSKYQKVYYVSVDHNALGINNIYIGSVQPPQVIRIIKKLGIPHEARDMIFNMDGRYLMVIMGDQSGAIYDWRKEKLVAWVENLPYYGRPMFQRFWIFTFAKLKSKDVYGLYALTHSRRGFLALGYKDGRIEIIREGKEL